MADELVNERGREGEQPGRWEGEPENGGDGTTLGGSCSGGCSTRNGARWPRMGGDFLKRRQNGVSNVRFAREASPGPGVRAVRASSCTRNDGMQRQFYESGGNAREGVACVTWTPGIEECGR